MCVLVTTMPLWVSVSKDGGMGTATGTFSLGLTYGGLARAPHHWRWKGLSLDQSKFKLNAGRSRMGVLPALAGGYPRQKDTFGLMALKEIDGDR